MPLSSPSALKTQLEWSWFCYHPNVEVPCHDVFFVELAGKVALQPIVVEWFASAFANRTFTFVVWLCLVGC